MGGIGHKLKHEFRAMVPITLFFLFMFLLLAFTRTLMLEQYGIHTTTFMAAAFGALLVAKVVLIADQFAFVNRYPEHPLVYNIVWKTAIYFIASFAARYGEHVIPLWRKFGDFAEANRRLIDEIVWPHFWCVQLWLFLLLLAFCTIRELIRALGRERVLALMFQDRQAAADRAPVSPTPETQREAEA